MKIVAHMLEVYMNTSIGKNINESSFTKLAMGLKYSVYRNEILWKEKIQNTITTYRFIH